MHAAVSYYIIALNCTVLLFVIIYLFYTDPLLNENPKSSDLLKLFKSSAAHYMIIGTALDVQVNDLLLTPGTATTNLILVFQRWINSNKDVTWRKVLQVCMEYPEEFGRVKAEVEKFLSSR